MMYWVYIEEFWELLRLNKIYQTTRETVNINCSLLRVNNKNVSILKFCILRIVSIGLLLVCARMEDSESLCLSK